MPDKIDLAALTNAIEHGQGCKALEVLSGISLEQRSTLMKDISQEHLKHRGQDKNLPLLAIDIPKLTGDAPSDKYIRASIEKVMPGKNSTNVPLFNETTFLPFQQSIFRCTDLKPDGSRQTKTIYKPFFEK